MLQIFSIYDFIPVIFLKERALKKPGLRILTVILASCLLASAPSRVRAGDDRLDRLEKEVTGLKQENEDLKKRLGDLEADQEEIRNNVGLLSKYLDVSGYADVQYDLTDSRTDNSKFRVRHLSFFFSKDITKEWKLFSEVDFEDAPRFEADRNSGNLKKAQGTVFVEQVYVEYRPSFSLDARLGRFHTPFGIWSIYHFPPYVPFQTNPLFFENTFPEVSDGIQLRYSFSVKDMPLDTNVYVSNGGGNAGGTDGNASKAVGARVNLEVVPGASLGGSYYRDRDNLNILRSSYGAHLLLSYKALKLQGEYVIRENEISSGPKFRDNGLYAALTYDLGKWTFAARYDRCRCNALDEQVAGSSLFRYTGAVNYHFAHNVVGKVEYDRTVSPDRSLDENRAIFAIAVAVGDL